VSDSGTDTVTDQAISNFVEPDLDLLRRFTETGDPDAFAEIVRRYAKVVYSASHRILGDEARAQDVSQETFFRLLRQPRLVTHSLSGWLHRSATHLAIDARRSELSRRHREKTYWLNQEAGQEGAQAKEPKWEDVSPYVDQALNELQEPMRGLLVRHFLQGVSQADLAEEMTTSPATISRRIKSGVEELQKHLRKNGVYLGLAALAMFCASNTSEAAPVKLLVELGKMRMIGTVPVSPPPPPTPPAHHPHLFRLRTANASPTSVKIAVGFAGAAILWVVLETLIISSITHSTESPPRQVDAPSNAAMVNHQNVR
jgi:RNA polymerase sigma factor (sigma-70 family)